MERKERKDHARNKALVLYHMAKGTDTRDRIAKEIGKTERATFDILKELEEEAGVISTDREESISPHNTKKVHYRLIAATQNGAGAGLLPAATAAMVVALGAPDLFSDYMRTIHFKDLASAIAVLLSELLTNTSSKYLQVKPIKNFGESDLSKFLDEWEKSGMTEGKVKEAKESDPSLKVKSLHDLEDFRVIVAVYELSEVAVTKRLQKMYEQGKMTERIYRHGDLGVITNPRTLRYLLIVEASAREKKIKTLVEKTLLSFPEIAKNFIGFIIDELIKYRMYSELDEYPADSLKGKNEIELLVGLFKKHIDTRPHRVVIRSGDYPGYYEVVYTDWARLNVVSMLYGSKEGMILPDQYLESYLLG